MTASRVRIFANSQRGASMTEVLLAMAIVAMAVLVWPDCRYK